MHELIEDLIHSFDLRPVVEGLSEICLSKAKQTGIIAAESANLETAAQFQRQSIEFLSAAVEFELLARKLTPPRNHGDEQLAAWLGANPRQLASRN